MSTTGIKPALPQSRNLCCTFEHVHELDSWLDYTKISTKLLNLVVHTAVVGSTHSNIDTKFISSILIFIVVRVLHLSSGNWC